MIKHPTTSANNKSPNYLFVLKWGACGIFNVMTIKSAHCDHSPCKKHSQRFIQRPHRILYKLIRITTAVLQQRHITAICPEILSQQNSSYDYNHLVWSCVLYGRSHFETLRVLERLIWLPCRLTSASQAGNGYATGVKEILHLVQDAEYKPAICVAMQ